MESVTINAATIYLGDGHHDDYSKVLDGLRSRRTASASLAFRLGGIVDKWIEIENTFLTNVPPIIVGRGKNKQRVPDPDIKATEMYLFAYECKRTKRGVSRRRHLRTLDAKRGDVESQLMDLVLRDDVIVIENQDDPSKYMRSNAAPTPVAGVKGAV